MKLSARDKGSLHDAEGIAAMINSVIAEGELTILDKPFTVQEEEEFLASLNNSLARASNGKCGLRMADNQKNSVVHELSTRASFEY